MVLSLLLSGLLVATTLAVVEFVQLRQARRELQRTEGDGTPSPQGGGLGKLLEDLVDELLGANPISTGPDLVRCLGELGQAQPAAPPAGTLEEQVDVLAGQVEDIRGLRFKHPVEPRFLSPDETSRRVQELFLKDYSAQTADTEGRILSALGAIPPGLDLRQTRAQALGSQVVGFYVPKTGELVVQTQDQELGALDRTTLAHELEHALADQNLGFPIPLEPKPGREDRDLAGIALVEGDATLTMQRYVLTLPFDQQLQLADPSLAAEAQVGLSRIPYYLRQELLFPYEDGLSFVCGRYAGGGWPAVNRAYADPPTTSAQILFPERYAAGEDAVDPSDPGDPGGGWSKEGEHELGAANLAWLFEAPGGERSRSLDHPLAVASVWAGGEVHVWERGEETALGVALAERPGEEVLCPGITQWYERAFPGTRTGGSASGDGLVLDGSRQDAILRCTADEVHLGIAPDLATAGRVARAG